MTTHLHHTFTRSPLRLIFCSLFLVAAVVAAIAAVASPGLAAKARSEAPAANASGGPDLVRLVGPIVSNTKVRDLPYIPPAPEMPEERLTRYPRSGRPARSQSSGFPRFQSLFE